MKFTSKIHVELLQSMGGDKEIANAAWVSTKAVTPLDGAVGEEQDAKVRGLINYLIKHRHGTPFEHGSLTFFVRAPIFVWREWHRHRVGFSYNEQSARYQQLEPEFWIPERSRPLLPVEEFKSARPKFGPVKDDKQFERFISDLMDSYDRAYTAYKYMLDHGYAKEVARAVLPVGIFSSCWVTCNPRSLMHFLSLRTHEESAKFISYPQHEIELAARACEKLFAEGWPITYEAFVKNGRVAP